MPLHRLAVGVLHPPQLHADEADREAELDRLSALDPRIELLVEPYVEPSELRTRRSRPDFVRGARDVTPLTPAQAAVLAHAEVVLALDLPFDTPAAAPRLRWVQAMGAGTGQLASAGLAAGGILLTNAAGTSAPEIAEFVVARILEHWKRLPEVRAAQDRAEWRAVYGRPLAGCTIGLIGLGAINGAVAHLAHALGLRVLASRRSAAGHPAVEELFSPTRLPAMVARCDVVVAAVPDTASTVGLVDRELLAAMKQGAYFCNVGRGSAVVDADLLAALDAGRLSGASLDVFTDEPLPPDDPYWRHPRVQLSAHCSSVPATSIGRVHTLFRDNLERYLRGESLRNEVELWEGR